MRLATTADHVLFDGFAEHPLITARALVCVARVAATRFYEPANMIAARIRAADPVVTSEPDRLRFEAFSQCCGVHVRYDLLPDGFDERASAPGTTNVDFGPDTIQALRGVTRSDPLRLTVGADTVSMQTFDAAVTEHRVPLPQRWVHGFGEVQVAAGNAQPILRLDATSAQRFLRGLPRGRAGHLTYWTAGSAQNTRLSPRPVAGGACVAGPTRLRVLEPLARFAESLTAYTDPDADAPTPVVWVLNLPGGRVSLSLSPDWQRGFTGEGGLLLDLATPSADNDARVITARLANQARFTLEDLTQRSGLPEDHCRAGLAGLSLRGELGHDIADEVFFWRRLPYPTELLTGDPPRLRDARRLAETGAVHANQDDDKITVTSGGHHYQVKLSDGKYSCTCPWVARHDTSRGPCKHVLAALLADQAAPQV